MPNLASPAVPNSAPWSHLDTGILLDGASRCVLTRPPGALRVMKAPQTARLEPRIGNVEHDPRRSSVAVAPAWRYRRTAASTEGVTAIAPAPRLRFQSVICPA